MTRCLYCERPFKPVTIGGHEKKFCSTAHKAAFERLCRIYCFRSIERETLSVEEMRRVAALEPVSPSHATAGLALAGSEVVGGVECSK